MSKELEPRGLKLYLHKYHLGYAPYYLRRDYEKEMEELGDPKFSVEEKW